MPRILRIETEDWFIPGGLVEPVECSTPLCPCSGSVNGPAADSPEMCGHEWAYNPDCLEVEGGEGGGEGCDRCDYDETDPPADPPEWYLQALLDFLSPQCDDPSPPLPTENTTSVCDYVAVITEAIASGPLPDDGQPPYLRWLEIVSWWEELGQGLSYLRCVFGTDVDDGLGDADLIPGASEMIVQKAEVELPPGSYRISSDCVDIDLDEECADCES